MLTKEKIKEIIKDSPLIVLLSELEIESIVEELYERYSKESSTIIYQRKEEYLCQNLQGYTNF